MKFTTLNIFKRTIQWYYVHSHSLGTVTIIHLQNTCEFSKLQHCTH